MSNTHLLNETHNPALVSWLESANMENTDFPIQNLPFASFKTKGTSEEFRGGVAIGDQVIDLKAVFALNLFDGDVQMALEKCSHAQLNAFMAMGKQYWSALRKALSMALTQGSEYQAKLSSCLVAQSDVEYALPCQIGDYTDFYTSIHHATSVGKKFRP
ncbi:MAG: fumarylacetoacetase, partial [Cognaticolwellia sp.]